MDHVFQYITNFPFLKKSTVYEKKKVKMFSFFSHTLFQNGNVCCTQKYDPFATQPYTIRH